MDSVWTKSVELPHFPKLEEDKSTTVLIIGGGITGILCAYLMQQNGDDYILVEGRRICSGATKNTTAKITSQHGLIYHKIIKSAGYEMAERYFDTNQMAVDKYFEICKDIDCDFETKTSYVYSLNDRKKLEEEAYALSRVGMHVQVLDKTQLPFPVAGAIGFENQAQFNPLKFIAHISKNLNIYENTFVEKLEDNVAITSGGKIKFHRVVYATHFPIKNKAGMYFLKLYQRRSYVIALKNAADLDGMYVDEARDGMSFRNYKDLLLIGGGGHRTGKQGGNWKELKDFAKKYYPSAELTDYWAAQDCMSLDGIPYIGRFFYRYNAKFDDLVATGFNKWGMTSAMSAAIFISNVVQGEISPMWKVYAPSRNMIKPQLFVNCYEAIKNTFTISKKRCPHLGCALKWNKDEHSWDCPCHGSRFDENGILIDNPANVNMHK